MRSCTVALACIVILAIASPAGARRDAKALQAPLATTALDHARHADVNRLNLFVGNDGSIAYDRNNLFSGGLIFPNHTTRTLIFAGGLWIGANIGAVTNVTVAEYAQEYRPGRILGGLPEPPGGSDLIVYKVRGWRGVPADTGHVDNPLANLLLGEDPLVHHSWSEYVLRAKPLGAPTRIYRLDNTATPAPGDSVNVEGPDVTGDQMTWSVYNDADATAHLDRAGFSNPLGVEVQQTTYAYDQPGTLGNVAFVRYGITNKGASTLDSTVVSLWLDPDLGAFADDLTGCDPTRNLGYAYNGNETDAVYGISPPALGVLVLQGPIRAPGDTLGMSAFTRYTNGTDPQSPNESYSYLRGLNANGTTIIDPVSGLPTHYMVSGDPVQGTGWIDATPADRRINVSMGAFRLSPGQSQTVVLALIAVQAGSRLQAVSELKFEADYVHNFYRGTIPTGGQSDVAAAILKTPDEVRLGCTPYEASFSIRNQGAAATGPFTSRIGFFTGASDIPLATIATPALNAGESYARVLSLSLDDAFGGRHRFYLLADTGFVVPDANTFNNQVQTAIQEAEMPQLRSVSDVLPDQGGQVRLNIARSSRDITGSATPVLQYEIYRLVESGAAALRPLALARSALVAGMVSDGASLLGTWDYLGAIPAHGDTAYSIVVPTLQDSSASGAHDGHFFVRAATAVPTTYFDSCIEAGHSLDNLAPLAPQNFRLTAIGGGPTISLAWDASTSTDVTGYALYRGTTAGFVPGASNQIAQLTSQFYTDANGAIGTSVYYKLSAVDAAGNHSVPVSTAVSLLDAPGGPRLPTAFAFAAGEPNPARDHTTFGFDLPVETAVNLTVFDVNGRVVRAPWRQQRIAAGHYEWQWDLRAESGRALGPGLYFVRFETPSYRRTVRSILLQPR